MKQKNVKAGVRVVHKGTGTNPERVGALGTILRGGTYLSRHTTCTVGGNSEFNVSSSGTYGAEDIKDLRIVK